MVRSKHRLVGAALDVPGGRGWFDSGAPLMVMRDLLGRDLSRDLDRYITGNYGEDQFKYFSEDEVLDGHEPDLCEFFEEVYDRWFSDSRG